MATENDTPKKRRKHRKFPPHTWHLVTNQQNMLYMLAAGMAMGPAGFRGKHYADSLSVFPGQILLFRDKVGIPANCLDQATSERKHLLPCVASFSLANLRGPVRMLSRDGRMRDVASPTARKRPGDIAVLIRAPLPMSLLSVIGFRSSGDMQAFASAARDVSNVELSPYRIEVAESLFLAAADATWPPAQLQGQLPLESGNDNPPALGQAIGGALAMLYHAANRSDLGLAAFRLATATAGGKDHELVQGDPLLAELPGWLSGAGTSSAGSARERLFWGVLRSLVAAQARERPQASVDVALAYLEDQLDQLQEMEFRTRLERLIADMRACLGLGGGTVTELLERHKGSLSRPLLLFCLREHCADLLEFSHPLLSETEYILACVLFGARDGWLRLPRELRHPDLSAYIAWRMAEAEHRKYGDPFILDSPSSPTPLRALFPPPGAEWDQKQKDAALELACEYNWAECVVTRITLAPGSDSANVESNDLRLRIQGKIVSVAEEVNKEKFLDRLGQWPAIASELELKVREKLGMPWTTPSMELFSAAKPKRGFVLPRERND